MAPKVEFKTVDTEEIKELGFIDSGSATITIKQQIEGNKVEQTFCLTDELELVGAKSSTTDKDVIRISLSDNETVKPSCEIGELEGGKIIRIKSEGDGVRLMLRDKVNSSIPEVRLLLGKSEARDRVRLNESMIVSFGGELLKIGKVDQGCKVCSHTSVSSISTAESALYNRLHQKNSFLKQSFSYKMRHSAPSDFDDIIDVDIDDDVNGDSAKSLSWGASMDAVSGKQLYSIESMDSGKTDQSPVPLQFCRGSSSCNRYPKLKLNFTKHSKQCVWLSPTYPQSTENTTTANKQSKYCWTIGKSKTCDIVLESCKEDIVGIIECRGTHFYLLTPSNGVDCASIHIGNLDSFVAGSHDVYTIGNDCEVCIKMDPATLCNAKSSAPSQNLSDIALELSIPYRTTKWSGNQTCDGELNTICKIVGKENVTIGKSDQHAMLTLADEAMGKLHCSLSKKGGNFKMSSESNVKPTYMTLGSSTFKWRTPHTLRTDDVFRAGRSEYCVLGKFKPTNYKRDLKNTQRNESIDNELLSRTSVESASLLAKVLIPGRRKSVDELDLEEKEDSAPEQHAIQQVEKNVKNNSGLFEDLMEEGFFRHIEGPFLILHCIKGPMQKRIYVVQTGETCIGSDPHNQIPVWNDLEMERLHCRILFFPEEGKWRLFDVDTEIGTYLRLPIQCPIILQTGDVLRAGKSLIKVWGKKKEFRGRKSRFNVISKGSRQSTTSHGSIGQSTALTNGAHDPAGCNCVIS